MLSNKLLPAICLLLPAPALAQQMPAKAEVTYQGTYVFTESRKTRSSSRIDLSKMLANAIDSAASGTRYEGALTIRATFDGPAVTAEVSGTGGVATLSLSGLIRDGACRLLDRRGGVVYEGSCSPDGFEGTISGTERYRANLRGSFQTATISFVDIAARDAEATGTRLAQEAEAAEHRRVNEEKRARLKTACDAGSVTACVDMDTLE